MVRHSARSQPSGLLGRPGYCRTTGGEEQKGCVPEQEQGWFSGTFVRIDQCLQSCVTCNTCHYATFSKRMNDCSWYAAARCNLQRLQTAAEGQHRSYRVRHFNGSVLSTVTARLARRAAASRVNGSAWVRQPARRLFFHEEDPEMLYLYSKRPNFRADAGFQKVSRTDSNGPLELLREWGASIRTSPLAAGASTALQHRTCAVVGSSASLLSRRHGAHIDAHDAVYRMNLAPSGSRMHSDGARYRKHVGARTTIRVWQDQIMPDLSNKWTRANETIVLYCGPTVNLIGCWWSLPTTGRPRLSPLAWEQANLAIHGASGMPTGAAIKFPSSGAMAVWIALTQCASVTLYGFGFCEPAEARAAGIAPNAVYYDPHDLRKKEGFGGYHNMEAEWAWIRSLKAQGLVKRVC